MTTQVQKRVARTPAALRGLSSILGRHLVWGLAGYAQVLFSTRPAVGLLAAAATFVSPSHGLAGLLGLASANLAAWLLELDAQERQQGSFAFNGLLVGLALGLYYRLNGPFLIAIVVGGFLVAALAAGLRALFARSLGIPVLSLPFLLVAWLLYGAAAQLPGLEVTLEPLRVAGATSLGASLPVGVDAFLRSCAAVFFQLSPVSGLLVFLALLLSSRLAALLGLVGYLAGQATYVALGGDPIDLSRELLGLNFIISAVAVGGVWTVPTLAGFGLAAIAGAMAAVVAAAAVTVLPGMGLPVLAFPLLVTTSIVLLALRGRAQPRHLVQPLVPVATPEDSLHEYRTRQERFVPGDRLGLPLPVGGRWEVTQSFDGPHTHRALWRHGLDLEAVDEDGRRCEGTGARPEDYYAFGVPVFAPLPGRVVAALSHLPDNPVGQVDTEHPWGNAVVLWHGGTSYSAYAHLARDSVVVSVGMDVAAGALLGKVGSSGRSPRPHLHLQAQTSPEIGAPTAPWTLLHWQTRDAEDADPAEIHTHGVPEAGRVLQGLRPDHTLAAAVAFPLGHEIRLRVTRAGRTQEERWRPELDFQSRLWLRSLPSGARLRLYQSPSLLLAEAYEGPRDTALHRLYHALPRLPLAASLPLRWSDRLEAGGSIGPLRRLLAELALPARRLVWLETRSRLAADEEGGWLVTTHAQAAGPLAPGTGERQLLLRLDEGGLRLLEERRGDQRLLRAEFLGTSLLDEEEP